MIYIQIVTLPFLHFCYVVGVRFNRVVIKYISLTCKRKIEEYIKIEYGEEKPFAIYESWINIYEKSGYRASVNFFLTNLIHYSLC